MPSNNLSSGFEEPVVDDDARLYARHAGKRLLKVAGLVVLIPWSAVAIAGLATYLIPTCQIDTGAGARGCIFFGIDLNGVLEFLLFGGFVGGMICTFFVAPIVGVRGLLALERGKVVRARESGTTAVEEPSSRPMSMTVTCALMAAYWLANVLTVVGDAESIAVSTNAIAAWYPAYLVGDLALRLAALAGLWRMRRWGIYVYFVSAVITLAVFYWLGESQFQGQQFLLVTAWLPPLLVGFVCAANFSRMR